VIIEQKAPDSFSAIAGALERGGIVIMKCDTIYGLVGIHPDAGRRIARLKNREAVKPFLILIPEASWLPRFTEEELPVSLRRYWPGPLTLVFTSRTGGTIALRVPEDDLLRKLMLHLRKPLISTSVNRSGEPPAHRIGEIARAFEAEVDLIVDSGDQKEGVPSTILDLSATPFRLIRQGRLVVPDELLRPRE
jgi:L-threonylcarbamoyladenylate synthase